MRRWDEVFSSSSPSHVCCRIRAVLLDTVPFVSSPATGHIISYYYFAIVYCDLWQGFVSCFPSFFNLIGRYFIMSSSFLSFTTLVTFLWIFNIIWRFLLALYHIQLWFVIPSPVTNEKLYKIFKWYFFKFLETLLESFVLSLLWNYFQNCFY